MLTADFETGFIDGYLWQGPDSLAEFLEARSVIFDESHEVLQLIGVTSLDDEDTVLARTRLRFFLRRHERPAAVTDWYGTPGGCGANQPRPAGELRRKSSTDLVS